MALTQYDKNNLTAAQQAGIQAATERYNNATTQAERDAAHAQAEAIRNGAGYTSDASGAYSGSYSGSSGGAISGSGGAISSGSSGSYDYGDNTTLQTNDRVSGITRTAGGTPYSQTGVNLSGYTLNDWVNDPTDYSTRALNSGGIAELQTWLSKRSMKADAQGIDISGNTPGILSNAQIASIWYANNGNYLDNYGRVGTTQTNSNFGPGYQVSNPGNWIPGTSSSSSGASTQTASAGALQSTPSALATANTTTPATGAAQANSATQSSEYADALAALQRAQQQWAQQSANQQEAYQQQLAQQQAQAEALAAELKAQYAAQQSAYAQALAAQRAAHEAAVQKAVGTLENQKTDTTNSYGDLFRQLYLNKMKNQKNLGQQMAALGVSGGAAESTLMGMNTQYEDALRQGEQGRLDALRTLDQAISDARLTGDIESANATADTLRQQTDNYASVLQSLLDRYDTLAARQQAYNREDEQLGWNRNYQLGRDAISDARYGDETDYSRSQYADALAYNRAQSADETAYSRQQDAQSWARQLALSMLAQGIMPDDETLSAAGISKADAAAMAAANAPTETGYVPTFSQQQVISAMNNAQKTGTALDGNMLRDYNYYFYGAAGA